MSLSCATWSKSASCNCMCRVARTIYHISYDVRCICVYTVFLAGRPPNKRSYAVQLYDFVQPYVPMCVSCSLSLWSFMSGQAGRVCELFLVLTVESSAHCGPLAFELRCHDQRRQDCRMLSTMSVCLDLPCLAAQVGMNQKVWDPWPD